MKWKNRLAFCRHVALLLLACAVSWSQETSAVRIQGGAIGAGAGVFRFETGQAVGGAHFGLVIGGGQEDVGASLLKACDSNQDGAVTPVELRAAMLAWFQSAD